MEKTQAKLEYEAELRRSEELRKIYLEQKENIRQLRVGLYFVEHWLRGNLQKKSIFKDIIQIKVDHPPFYPIFDKLFLTNYFWQNLSR